MLTIIAHKMALKANCFSTDNGLKISIFSRATLRFGVMCAAYMDVMICLLAWKVIV